MNGITPQEQHARLVKEIKKYENRLDKANQKYNSTVAYNRKLRDEIDTLRRERLVFKDIFDQLTKDLQEKKRDMETIVKIANSANHDREKAMQELADLIKQAEQEKAEFDKQIAGVNQKILEERAKKESLQKKEEEQNRLEREYKEEKAKEEEYFKKQSATLTAWGGKDKVECLIPEEKLTEYQAAFDKICEECKVDDIDELVKNFIEAEERNFSLTQFVEELTRENEELDAKITGVKAQIEEYKNQGLGHDNERKRRQKELEERIKASEQEYEAAVREYQQALRKIKSIKESIDEIFSLVDNDVSVKYKEMSASQGITHENIMTYLGMVEEMINGMIKQYAHYLAENLKAQKNLDPSDPTIVTLNNILMVAPKTEVTKCEVSFQKEDEEMSMDEEDKPLRKEDFQRHFDMKARKA